MDTKKKLTGLVSRMFVPPAALSLMFGAFASNASALEPVVNDTIDGADFGTAVAVQQQNNNNNHHQMSSAAKPGSLRQIDAAMRVG